MVKHTTIAREIERARRELGLSRAEYAQRIGISRQGLYGLLTVGASPTLKTIRALRDKGGCRGEKLLAGRAAP